MQVFRNLLENSLASCSDPVEITITCREFREAGDETIQIGVCDNGPGLDPETRKRVFEPFFTTKTKGTGLGMAIAYRIVTEHGGVVDADNRPKGGARIRIRLPLAKNEAIP